MIITPYAYAATPDIDGQWSPIENWGHGAIHMNVLPNGKILFWYVGDHAHAIPRLFDPATGIVTDAPPLSYPTGYNAFCSGHNTLSDGGVMVIGGHFTGVTREGAEAAAIYRFTTNSWEPAPDMNAGRWYPTAMTLADGRLLALAGEESNGVTNQTPQIYDPVTKTWGSLSTALRDEDPYPRTFNAPTGEVFLAGPETTTPSLSVAGTGAWSANTLRHALGAWRIEAPAAMYEPGKILIAGGKGAGKNGTVTATAEVINLNDAVPAWEFVAFENCMV